MTEERSQPSDDELRELLVAAALSDASREQIDRLNSMLLADEAKRHYAARFFEEETLLRQQIQLYGRIGDLHDGLRPVYNQAHPPSSSEQDSNSNAIRSLAGSGTARRAMYSLALAASVLVVIGAALYRTAPSGTPQSTNTQLAQARPLQVGVLETARGVQWDSTSLQAGSSIRVGDRLAIKAGVADLRFRCGAQIYLKGPADLEVISPMRAALHRGTLTARVEETAHGFRIDTPNSKVTDLGTEFGVSVDEKGATDMVVFSGKVVWEYIDAGPQDSLAQAPWLSPSGRLLTDGEAMRITEGGELERLATIRSTDYPLANDRDSTYQWTPVIESVSDNLREGDTSKCYRIVHQGFAEDARAFVDRPYQWNGLNAEFGLPNFLRNADYVMPFCDDKLSSQLELQIALDRPARLYVLIDNRVELPQWLSDNFADTGYDVGVDESAQAASWLSLGQGPGVSIDKTFSVWSLDVTKKSTVVLGSMKAPQIQSLMYCVAAVPLGVALAIEADPLRFHQPRIGSGHIRPDLLPTSQAQTQIERVESLDKLTIAQPSPADAASSQRGLKFRLESVDGKYPPHRSVTVVDGALPVLNDGLVSRNHDDLPRNVWYDGQGRFSLDLGASRPISQINAFSWHQFERTPQLFTVWGSNVPHMPSASFDETGEATGWELIGYVKTGQLGDGGVHASSLRAGQGALGPYRYLLWIAEDVKHSTFFTEIDVHTAE